VARALTERAIDDSDLFPGPELVETYLRLGRLEEAVAVAAQHEESARAKGQPWARARAARVRGLLASDDELEPRVRRGARTARQHARHVRDGANAARLRSAPPAGGPPRRRPRQLRAAIDSFDALGAAPWADLARNELEATGETARRRDVSTLDELTPQELQIAVLLAEGRTTRQVAAALFLSPKTIEYHLRNLYRKLGIHSREELFEAVSRLR
jgi:Response regulator containing a CheY-like receiver domain and an HTH DNA-binding domain